MVELATVPRPRGVCRAARCSNMLSTHALARVEAPPHSPTERSTVARDGARGDGYAVMASAEVARRWICRRYHHPMMACDVCGGWELVRRPPSGRRGLNWLR